MATVHAFVARLGRVRAAAREAAALAVARRTTLTLTPYAGTPLVATGGGAMRRRRRRARRRS